MGQVSRWAQVMIDSGWVWERSSEKKVDSSQEYSTITNSRLVVYIQREMGKTWGKGRHCV